MARLSRARTASLGRRRHASGALFALLGLALLGLALLGSLGSCTVYHSRQAMFGGGERAPDSNATFVTEEDSGLSLLGVFLLSEPDHFAVLLERARRRHRCARMHHAQLDFYSDYWILVAFPIARVTLVCDPPDAAPATAVAAPPTRVEDPPPTRAAAPPAAPTALLPASPLPARDAGAGDAQP